MKSLSRVWLLVTPWTAAYQAPPSMGFSRQESWSGVPLPSPKGPEKIFKEIIAENFLNMGKEIVSQVQEAQSPRKDKPKKEHMETYSPQTDKN